MHFKATLILVAATLATVTAAAPTMAGSADFRERETAMFDNSGDAHEADLTKRINPTYRYVIARERDLTRRNNPKFDYPGHPREAEHSKRFNPTYPYGYVGREANISKRINPTYRYVIAREGDEDRESQ